MVDRDGDQGTTPDEQTFFLYDQGQIVLQFDKTGTGDATTSDLSHRYLWGDAVDQLLADESTSGEAVWPLTDDLGTVHDLAEHDKSTRPITIDARTGIAVVSSLLRRHGRAMAGLRFRAEFAAGVLASI